MVFTNMKTLNALENDQLDAIKVQKKKKKKGSLVWNFQMFFLHIFNIYEDLLYEIKELGVY